MSLYLNSAFYVTWRLITAFTSARHPSLSWTSSIQFIPPHPTSRRSILILSSHLYLGLPSSIFPSGFPTRTLYMQLFSPIRAVCPAHLILLKFITRTAYLNVKQFWLWWITLNITVFGPEERGGNNGKVQTFVWWRAIIWAVQQMLFRWSDQEEGNVQVMRDVEGDETCLQNFGGGNLNEG